MSKLFYRTINDFRPILKNSIKRSRCEDLKLKMDSLNEELNFYLY
jgi:hypothetical protein